MAYREKLAWISLASTLIVFGIYAASLAHPLVRGDLLRMSAGARLIAAIIAEIIITSSLAIVAAVRSPRDAALAIDEREAQIFANANSWGYGVLCATMWTIILAGLFGALDGQGVALGCLLGMITSEIVRSGGQIIGYRRGV